MSLLTSTEASKYALVILTLGGLYTGYDAPSALRWTGLPRRKDQRDIYGLIPVPIAHPE